MDISKIILDEYKKLGGGDWGKVFEKGGFAYKVTKDDTEFEIAEELMLFGDELKSFPVIYSVKPNKDGSYYIIKRDVYNLLSKEIKNKINKNIDFINTYINTGNRKSFDSIKNDTDNYISEEFIKFLIQLRKDYLKLNMPQHHLDVHGGNIGIDKSGNYVLFDF